MPHKTAGKKLTPLRSGDIRYLSGRPTGGPSRFGTAWASCNKNITQVQFLPPPLPVSAGPGFYISGQTAGIITTIFAAFAFAPLAAPGLVLGYSGSAATGGVLPVVTTGLGGNLGFFLTGLLATLDFASPDIDTARYTEFNKPCSDPGGN